MQDVGFDWHGGAQGSERTRPWAIHEHEDSEDEITEQVCRPSVSAIS